MPKLVVPNSATIHTARAFFRGNRPFTDTAKNALLRLHPRWLHVEPMALAMIAAWGAWCRRQVTIAVADCGRGIADHLGQVHPEALTDDRTALGLAMRPGITGAKAGMYGVPDNAGAGLFITRCMAKGTGGYFLLSSGRASYRLRRARDDDEMVRLCIDAYDDPRHDDWLSPSPWHGTVVSVEIRTEKIGDYGGFFQWIFDQIPRRESRRERIKFT